MRIYKEFKFESAHFLPNVPTDHKCRRLHGHNYTVQVCVDGDLSDKEGWVVDYAHIGNMVDPLIKKIDHCLLNDVDGLENPTAEHVAIWFWDRLRPDLPSLSMVSVKECSTTGAIYEGP